MIIDLLSVSNYYSLFSLSPCLSLLFLLCSLINKVNHITNNHIIIYRAYFDPKSNTKLVLYVLFHTILVIWTIQSFRRQTLIYIHLLFCNYNISKISLRPFFLLSTPNCSTFNKLQFVCVVHYSPDIGCSPGNGFTLGLYGIIWFTSGRTMSLFGSLSLQI